MFRRVNSKYYFIVGTLICITLIISGYFLYKHGVNNSISNLSSAERITLINEKDSFSREKMIVMLHDLNIKFPWIPMAQSMIETGQWKSDIFLENNNLFGMREAKSRITTAIGTNNNHAEYNSWRDSVYDYAFYQSRYLGNIKSESEYYQYLAASYAEDPNYISKVKNIVEAKGLKNLFN